jgi:hypothetical protein
LTYNETVLDRDHIVTALARVAAILRERQTEGEICLLGGTVMVLAFKARPATKDVDAIFQPTAVIREAAAIVQEELGLPEAWLNDGAKGFVSTNHQVEEGDLPQFEGLRITAPTAEYMLAMKCMASRIAQADTDPSDVADIRFLLDRLGIETADQALAIVGSFYPPARVPVRTAYLLEDILAERRS